MDRERVLFSSSQRTVEREEQPGGAARRGAARVLRGTARLRGRAARSDMSKPRVVELLDDSEGEELAVLVAPVGSSSGAAGKKRQRESSDSVEIVERPGASSSSSGGARAAKVATAAKAATARRDAPAVPPGNSLRDIVRERQGGARSSVALRGQEPVALVPRAPGLRERADDGEGYLSDDEDLGEHGDDRDLAFAIELSRRDAGGFAAAPAPAVPRVPRRPEPPIVPGRGRHQVQALEHAHALARAQSQSQQEADLARAVELSKASEATQLRKEQDEALQRSIEEDRRKAKAKRTEERALAAAERAKVAAASAAARAEERAREAAKEAKAAKAAALVRRREQLQAALPAEPSDASGVLLRFDAPGGKVQRAFRNTDRLRDVLAWMQVCDGRCLRAHVFAAVLPGPCEYLSDLPPHKQNESLGQLGFIHRCVVRQRIVQDGEEEDEEEQEEQAKHG